MKQSKLEIYETTVDVYELQQDIISAVSIEGIEDDAKDQYVRILDEGNIIPQSREPKSYYAVGFAKEKEYILMADNIDTKQLSNLFLSFGVYRANALAYDISKIKITESKEVIAEQINLALHKINADVVSNDYLGTKGNRIVVGTITTEDLIKEVQTPAVKPKTKKKSTRK